VHYARHELAHRYLQSLNLGLCSARVLFGKRGIGKSEFLELDLIPAAQAEGYVTAYLNLWEARTHLTTSLLAELGRALGPKALSKLLPRLNTPLKKVRATGKQHYPADGLLEAELAKQSAISGLLLGEMLDALDNPDKPMLLVLDEAQVLANPLHSELAHSLRAGLDHRKQNIKVVFAGSSETMLRRMFGRESEPFYYWAPMEPFALLGAEFIKAMVAKVNNLSQLTLTEEDALAAFVALNSAPDLFRRYLSRYLANEELGPQAALENTQAHVFGYAKFREAWKKMLPADREVLKLIVNGESDLHSEPTCLRLALALGLDKPVGKDTPQHSLRRLQDEGLVAMLDDGEYQVQDDAFGEWMRNLELDS
jgi:hypothetical protein